MLRPKQRRLKAGSLQDSIVIPAQANGQKARSLSTTNSAAFFSLRGL